MKKTLRISFSICWLISFAAISQTIGPNEIRERGEISDSFGYLPKSMESLVGTPTIIVRGRFGDYISNTLSYGYGETRESFIESRRVSEKDADRFAIPMSDYEIIVDEVLLGEVNNDVIIYRIIENEPIDREFTDPSVERIFFLGATPDENTYSPLGPGSVLNKDPQNGTYGFSSLTRHRNAFRGVPYVFADDMSVESFEKALKNQISIEKSKRSAK